MYHKEKLGVTLYKMFCQAQSTSQKLIAVDWQRGRAVRDRERKQHRPPSTALVSQYEEKEEAILQPPSITDSTPDNFHFSLFLSHAPISIPLSHSASRNFQTTPVQPFSETLPPIFCVNLFSALSSTLTPLYSFILSFLTFFLLYLKHYLLLLI